MKSLLLVAFVATPAYSAGGLRWDGANPAASFDQQVVPPELRFQASPRAQAEQSAYETLKAMARDNPGVCSFRDIEKAEVQTPLRYLVTRPDRLRRYRPGDTVAELFSGQERYIYPVAVGGAVGCSFQLSFSEAEGWKAGQFGLSGLSARIGLFREGAPSVVEAAGALFLAHRENGRPVAEPAAPGEVWLTALFDLPQDSFPAGAKRKAEGVFAALGSR